MSLRQAPVGFADGTAAAPMTGAPAAYCFDIHTLRASRTGRLSALEHHRYVQVLDWKVARRFQITFFGAAVDHLQVHADREFLFIFKSCERLKRVARKALGQAQAESRISIASRLPSTANAAFS